MAYKPLHSLVLVCLQKHLFEMTPPFTHYALVQRLEIRRLRILRDNSLYVSWDFIHLASKGKDCLLFQAIFSSMFIQWTALEYRDSLPPEQSLKPWKINMTSTPRAKRQTYASVSQPPCIDQREMRLRKPTQKLII